MSPLQPTWKAFVALKRVRDDPRETNGALERAAEAGNFFKECVLAQRLLSEGEFDKAHVHYCSASQSKIAIYNVGVMHELGLGSLEVSKNEALRWYARAPDMAESQHRVGIHMVLEAFARNKEGEILPDATLESEDKDFRRGLELVRTAAKAGVPEAMFDLGMIYLLAIGVKANEMNEHIGEKWLRTALTATQRDPFKEALAAEVAFQLALFYYATQDASRATPEARDSSTVACAEFAASHSHALAQDFMGQLCIKGCGDARKPDMAKARHYFRLAADQNVVSSIRDLALLIDNGHGGEDDTPETCVDLYKRAADAGDMLARVRLALCYGKGIPGVLEKDENRGTEMMLNAAREGSVMAMAHAVGREMARGQEAKQFLAKLAGIARDKEHPNYGDALSALVQLGRIPACAKCRKAQAELDVKLKSCSSCKLALYCSQECQTGDWKQHAKECRAVSQMRAKSEEKSAAANAASEEGANTPPTPVTPLIARTKSHSEYDSMPDFTGTPDSDSDSGSGSEAHVAGSEGTGTPPETSERESVLPRVASTGTLITNEGFDNSTVRVLDGDIADATPLLPRGEDN